MELTWTFERRPGERLDVHRRDGAEGPELVVTCTGQPERRYPFSDYAALTVFQANLESYLLKDGWSFTAFSPERRSRPDRRNVARGPDRRRRPWWARER